VNVPASMIGGGRDQYGRIFAGALFEAAVGGNDASAVMDGLDTSMFPSNPEGDFTDAEIWENIFPIIWLGRRKDPDGGGMGKFRGGNGIQSLYFIANTKECMLGSITFSDYVFDTPGVMGAYPAAANYKYFVVNTNLKDVIEKRLPLPHTVGEDPSTPEWEKLIKGETVRVTSQMGVRPFKEYDLFLQFNRSGGALGDPIDRDPKAVQRDLIRGDTTDFAAKRIYCVAIDPDTKEIDRKGTERLRADMRKARLTRGKPAETYVQEMREKLLKGEIPTMPKTCINQILVRAPRFKQDFIECWGLPPDFERIE
jgi:acetone carboxylase alpha subunit